MLLGNKVARVEHIKPLNHENSLNITNSMDKITMHVLEVILRLVCVQRFSLLALNQFNNKINKRLFQQPDKVIVS